MGLALNKTVSIKTKSKREAVLYTRVAPINKRWVEKESVKLGKSKSEFMDEVITHMRKTGVAKTTRRKAPGRARKSTKLPRNAH